MMAKYTEMKVDGYAHPVLVIESVQEIMNLSAANDGRVVLHRIPRSARTELPMFERGTTEIVLDMSSIARMYEMAVEE